MYYKTEKQNYLNHLRHSTAHLLAAAVMELWPKAKRTIGPAIENGFYYDFDFGDVKVSEEDFPKIEAKMRELLPSWKGFERHEVSIEETKKEFVDNPYKLELIDEFSQEGKNLTIYQSGDFRDLCRGGRMLGEQLDFFSTSPLTGQGLILWHPKLSISRDIVERFWKREHYQHGYKLVYTPHIATMDMFVKTRHLTKYVNSMFPVMLHEYIEGESAPDYTKEEVLKPMNCPNHVQIYRSRPRSYRELPLRLGELGTVYRYERAGVLHGLTRVRGFTQDDSHIFCRPDQVIAEVKNILQLTRYFYQVFGFKDYQAYLATRPEKYLGTIAMWEFSQNSLKKALEDEHISYKIDEGEGVFYGPKIDSKIKDSLGREWQLGTIQFDFNQPAKAETTDEEIEEFWNLKTFKYIFKTKETLAKYLKRMGRGLDVTFANQQGKEESAVMIHRTILGSMERFFGILIEHYAGAFPFWLSPVQVAILPISDKQLDYGKRVYQKIFDSDIRVELDGSNETLSKKIRNWEMQKVPYIAVVGKREEEEDKLAIRKRGEGDRGTVEVNAFIKLLHSLSKL
ncbi:threonine--tRNA ligase [Candidatus Gottesmanbacteria bacterium]|nr:threonine--tRNA ligase [Candidatus Gottesmanbacteria bacterium]